MFLALSYCYPLNAESLHPSHWLDLGNTVLCLLNVNIKSHSFSRKLSKFTLLIATSYFLGPCQAFGIKAVQCVFICIRGPTPSLSQLPPRDGGLLAKSFGRIMDKVDPEVKACFYGSTLPPCITEIILYIAPMFCARCTSFCYTDAFASGTSSSLVWCCRWSHGED